MRRINILAAMVFFLSMFGLSTASAQVLADYAGRFDLHYVHASANFTVTVTLSTGDVISIPLAVDVAMDESELIPTSVADDAVANVMLELEGYFPGAPTQIVDAVESAFTTALYELIGEINSQAARLPDEMGLGIENERYNMVSGKFVNVDEEGDEFSLSGTLYPDTGEFSMMEVFFGAIDANANFDGDASWYIDVDIEQPVNAALVQIAGELELQVHLTQICSADTCGTEEPPPEALVKEKKATTQKHRARRARR